MNVRDAAMSDEVRLIAKNGDLSKPVQRIQAGAKLMQRARSDSGSSAANRLRTG